MDVRRAGPGPPHGPKAADSLFRPPVNTYDRNIRAPRALVGPATLRHFIAGLRGPDYYQFLGSNGGTSSRADLPNAVIRVPLCVYD